MSAMRIPPPNADIRRRGSSPKDAFTRTDLVTTIALVAVLALLQIPARGNSNGMSKAGVCLSNLRRLATAWAQFAADNDGTLPAADVGGQSTGWIEGGYAGSVGFGSDYTNTVKLVGAKTQLGSYTQKPLLYRCPADESRAKFGSRIYPRARSYSMSVAMNSDTGLDWVLPSSQYRMFRKMSQITAPTPSRAFVFLEEHPDSIDDGVFAVNMPGPDLAKARFQNFPGAYHDRAGALAFADGHAELHLWSDSRTTPSVAGKQLLDTPSPNNADIRWLSDRTSSSVR